MSPTPQRLQITAASPDPALLLDLPWHIPLEDWPAENARRPPPRHLAAHRAVRQACPAGSSPSRRSARRSRTASTSCCASCAASTCPSVEPVGVITGRADPDGEPLEAVLITEHLQFSLPYRALFSQSLRPDTATRLIDALAVLLVRLHLVGFYWGDVSLSNTLFRRDAETFAAYLVDAETGDLHDTLTDGQRGYDLEVARVNIIGELMDLQAGEFLEEDVDAVAIGGRARRAVRRAVARADRVRVVRLRATAGACRPASTGSTTWASTSASSTSPPTSTARRVRIQPKVVDAGHHSRRLMRLTGLDVQENQARRLLNDLDEYRAATDRQRRGRVVRRARLADRDLRARGPRRPPRPARQARARADVPRAARPPLVPVASSRAVTCPMSRGRAELRQEHPAEPARRAGDPRRRRPARSRTPT